MPSETTEQWLPVSSALTGLQPRRATLNQILADHALAGTHLSAGLERLGAVSVASRLRRLDQAGADVQLADEHLEASVTMMTDALLGQPRSARYDDEPGVVQRWCFDHSRTVEHCFEERRWCSGVAIRTIPDPTGDAATTKDPAARALAEVDRGLTDGSFVAALLAELLMHTTLELDPQALERIDRSLSTMTVIAARLAVELIAWAPMLTDAHTPDPSSVNAPGGWCENCFAHGRFHSETARRPNGKTIYAKWCRFCGDYRSAQKALPPAEIVRIHHTPGKHVTKAVIAKYGKKYRRKR